jgi:hypothetical protein
MEFNASCKEIHKQMKPQIKIEGEFEIHKIDYVINASEYYDKNHTNPYIWVTDSYNASKNTWRRIFKRSYSRKSLNKSKDPIIIQVMMEFNQQQPTPQPKQR